MLTNLRARFAALPIAGKVVLIGVGLALLAASSPLLIIVAAVALVVSVFVLILQAAWRRPLKRWGIAAGASLVFLIVLYGVATAMYGNQQPEQVASTSKTKEEAANEEAMDTLSEGPEGFYG